MMLPNALFELLDLFCELLIVIFDFDGSLLVLFHLLIKVLIGLSIVIYLSSKSRHIFIFLNDLADMIQSMLLLPNLFPSLLDLLLDRQAKLF